MFIYCSHLIQDRIMHGKMTGPMLNTDTRDSSFFRIPGSIQRMDIKSCINDYLIKTFSFQSMIDFSKLLVYFHNRESSINQRITRKAIYFYPLLFFIAATLHSIICYNRNFVSIITQPFCNIICISFHTSHMWKILC